MIRPVLVLLAVLLVLGCSRDPDAKDLPTFDPHGHEDKAKAKDVHKLIQELRFYERPDDPEADARYYSAQDALIREGTRIQGQLIEALATHRNWGVRRGVLEVLNAVGDRDCVPGVITALDDDHPLVALKAMMLLRQLCNHRIVPETGVADSGLPAVPTPDPERLEVTAEDLWTRWFLKHGRTLHQSWKEWWAANKLTIQVQ